MKILTVGGTWNEAGGKPSGLINKIAETLMAQGHTVCLYNGGTYNDLKKIIKTSDLYDYVFWFCNVGDNGLEKIRDVKEYAPKCMLITSKRNDNNKYDFEELLQRALKIKANLCFEFSKTEDKLFNIRVFDPLGCVWYEGTDIKAAVSVTLKRLSRLKNFTRKPSIHNPETCPVQFDEKDKEFLEFVKSSADTFHKLMCLPDHVDRFVGNASLRFKEPTRCMSGFPAIRKDDMVLISRRNVDKTGISEKDFVPCFLNDSGNVEYFGEAKPSVDSPIQVRLFKAFPKIDYILHGHCYVKNGDFATVYPVPCGAVEEAYSIIGTFNEDTDFEAFNLKGHGCIIMASKDRLDDIKNVKFEVRPCPEKINGLLGGKF